MPDGNRDGDQQSADDDVSNRGCSRFVKGKAEWPEKGVLIRTFCLSIIYFMLGVGTTLMGATVVHLEWLYNADTATAALVFPSTSLGALIGSFICAVVYDRIIKYRELSFGLLYLTSAATIISAPYVGDLGGLPAVIAMVFIWMIPKGYLYAGCSSYSVNMWEGNWLRDSVVQSTFALWSLGATIGPLIIKNFLVELPEETIVTISTNDSNSSYTTPGLSEVTAAAQTGDSNAVAVTDSSFVDVSSVKLAFVVIGAMEAVPALLFIGVHFFSKSPNPQQASPQQQQQQELPEKNTKDSNVESGNANTPATENVEKTAEINIGENSDLSPSLPVVSDSKQSEEPSKSRYRRLYVAILVLMFLFYNFQMFVESNFMSYLTSFAIKYNDWSVKAGTDVMALYYFLQFGAFVLSVPLLAFAQPQVLLIADQIILTVACLLLLLVDVWSDVLWLSAAMAGFGTACTFGSMILWIANRIAFTGLVSALVMLGTATGNIIGPLIVGQLFDTVTPLSFVYMAVASVAAVGMNLLILLAFDRRCGEELKFSDNFFNTNGDLSSKPTSSNETIDDDKSVTDF